MLKVNYAKISLKTAEAIRAAGGPAALLRRDQIRYPVRVLLINYSVEERQGDLIQQMDRRALLSVRELPQGIVPNAELDKLVLNDPELGETAMRIVTVNRLGPAINYLLYDLQVRP